MTSCCERMGPERWNEAFARHGVSSAESVFGPAEIGERLGNVCERQAHNVEVAAFDAGDVAAGAALDGVGAGFVVGLFCGQVTRDFFW